MKRVTTILAAGLLGLLGAALAEAEVPEVMTTVAAKAAGALANVEFDVENELGRSKAAGTGICIHANGTLLTTALDVFTPPEMIKNIRIVLPGKERKTVEAKLLGIDRQAGVTFVQATGEHKWSVVRFARRTNLTVGQTVVSVG
ncbi:MAG TPA: trypsin-like peptidase domain-containing protein, partial [Phycisphaerae bacterium]|nr:trypsin-like peptidase domain-containing protein [Phycisphaerae bacterium]